MGIAVTEEVACLYGYVVVAHGGGGAPYLSCAIVQQQPCGQARGREEIRILRCLYCKDGGWRDGAVAVAIVVYGSDLGSVESFGIDAEVVQHAVHGALLTAPSGEATKLQLALVVVVLGGVYLGARPVVSYDSVEVELDLGISVASSVDMSYVNPLVLVLVVVPVPPF